jgi:serine/threonine protein kinase
LYKSKQIFDLSWSDWKIDKFLGKGSVGTVYKIYNKSLFKTKYSALKIINIPTEYQIHNIKQFHKINTNEEIEKYINES